MDINKLSFKNFRRKKLRSILTMLGIVIGVTTLILLVGLASGMTSSIKEQSESIMGDIIIAPEGQAASASPTAAPDEKKISSETVSKIKQMPQLFDFKEYTAFPAELNGEMIIVEGTNDWSQIKLKNGTTGVVIDQNIADNFGYKIGSKIKIKDKELTVTGIATTSNRLVYININEAFPMTNNELTMISARTKGDPKTISKEIDDQVKEVDVLTKSDIVADVEKMTNNMLLYIGGIASIGLIVGAISIINIMLVSVMERTREIGVLKATGFTNREIMRSTTLESGLLGFIGSIVGVIIGAAGILLMAQGSPIENVSNALPLWLIAGVIGGATFLSILAGLYPALCASRLNVVEALRHE